MKSIKTLAAIAFAALTLSLTGCSKDPEDLIIGSWEMTSMTMSLTSSETPDQPWVETWSPEAGESTVLTFNKDNTMTITETADGHSETENGTYNVDDNTLSMTYTVEDGPLTKTQTFTISKIDKKNMTLTANESGEEDGVTLTESLTIELAKK